MLLVTGATGTTGTAVLRALQAKGVAARGLIRDDAKAEHVRALGAEPVVGDLADPPSLSGALAGVERAYLVTPFSPKQPDLEQAFVEAAARAGVRHVVKLSVIGASPEAPVRFARSHAVAERTLRESELAWTFLRPSGFMQNNLAWAAQLRDGTFYTPCPHASVAVVDARDIGEVAAEVLTGDGHEGKAYGLTGPEAVSFRDQALRLFGAAGREIAVEEVPLAEVKAAMLRAAMPQWNVDALGELLESYAAGGARATTSGVQDVLGRPPRSLDDFARDHVDAFAEAEAA